MGAPSRSPWKHPLRFCRVAAGVAASALLGAGATNAAAQEPSANQGAAIVERLCAACHAVGPAGPSRHPAALPLRDLHRRYDPEALSEALAEGLHVGNPDMPAFRFDPGDVQSVILYLEAIQDESGPSARPRSQRAPG
ncbi:cytochrome c [uncultured Phenylobacterium sp.]|uniref:c-type cytochrome n=1 Tax=uncultured Phenylobacterium sp. TaxID=349273 RepID=UPI0025E0EF6B|nr:cytochrome c [uncultured Phenylobacterium sp.]